MYGRGGKHNDDSEKIQCQGSAYKVRLDFDGTPDLAKEYYHSGGGGAVFYKGDKEDDIKVSATVEKNIPSVMKRWVGMKCVVRKSAQQKRKDRDVG